jgi:ribonuclease E
VAPDREAVGYSYFGSNNTAADQPKADEKPDFSTEEADKPARERKSRDRYGRDRRERHSRSDQPVENSLAAEPTNTAVADEVSPAPAASSQATAVLAAAAGMPKVRPFTLPVAELTATATGAGLEWVASNAEKVQQVQAAIAATPAAVHVPRERRPLVVLDEGPLVLVETRTDLAKRQYPFDTVA